MSKLFDKIPTKSEQFFIELGYGVKNWKSQRTRISNKIDMTLAETLDVRQIYQILKQIMSGSSKVKQKAIEWKNLIDREAINSPQEIILEQVLLEIEDSLLNEYHVSLLNVTEKHRIITEHMEKSYIYECNKRINIYRLGYDVSVCKLLKRLYIEGRLPGMIPDKSTFLDEYIPEEVVKKTSGYKYKAIHKDGTKIDFNGLNSFCEDNDLTLSAIKKCLTGKQKTHKGWTIYEGGGDE